MEELKDNYKSMGIKFKSKDKGLGEFITSAKSKSKSIAYRQYLKADVLRNSACFKESIKYYLSSILIDRFNYKTYMGLGIAYKSEGRYEKAIEALEKAKKMSYFSSDIHFELGICYLYARKPCEAINSLKNAILLDRNNLQAQLQLAIAHEFIEEYDMAILIYETIIENDPTFISAYNHLAAVYMNFEEYKSAGNVFAQILKINPDYYKAHLGLAICFDKMSQNPRAVHYYKMYMEKKPHSHHCEKIKKRVSKLQNKRTPESAKATLKAI